MNLPPKIQNFFQGHERSVRAKKNIALSFVFKGFSILISLMLVPMTLKYLNASEYGVWLTLSSILTWINFFDIGLGNGLRNKLTEALTVGDNEKARIYVSTTFAILTMIMAAFFIIFAVVNPFLDWSKILNTSPETAAGLSSVVIIVFAFFCLSFVFKTVGIIFIAAQKPAINDLLGVIGSALSLGIIYALTLFTNGSLYYVAFTFSLTPVIVFVIAYFLIFYSKYKFLRPSLNFVKFKYSKDLMGLGMKFFVIQIAGLVIYSTSNIIIAQKIGLEEVTIYNIAYKYFNVMIMFFSIIQATLWNAYTDAWARQDIQWIKNSIKKSKHIWAISSFVVIVMLFCSNYIYKIWIGDAVVIPLSLSMVCCLMVILNNWSSLFVNFINGVGKIKIQLYASTISTIVFLPMAIYLCENFGIIGIPTSFIIIMLPGLILSQIQYHKLINNSAKGLWNQ